MGVCPERPRSEASVDLRAEAGGVAQSTF